MTAEVAQRDEVVLRHATEADLPAIDHLTRIGYAPIQESFVAMLGADLYETVSESVWLRLGQAMASCMAAM